MDEIDKNELLSYLSENGIIDEDMVRHKIEEMRNNEYLSRHTKKVWKGENGYWYTYIDKTNGERKLIKKNTKQELESFLIDFYKQDYTIRTYFDIWKERQKNCGKDSNTLVRYDSTYKRFLEGDKLEKMSVQDITTDDIEQWIFRILSRYDLKYKALSQGFQIIKGIFNKARIDRIIKENPCDHIDLPVYRMRCESSYIDPESRVLQEAECRALIEKLKESYINNPTCISNYAVEFALMTGLRPGELAYLRWEHINYKEGYIAIDGSEKQDKITLEYYDSKTKTKKVRRIPLTEQIKNFLDVLKKLEMRHGFLTEYVFSGKEGRIHVTGMYDAGQRKCRQAGLDKRGIQMIRRTYNSYLKSIGVDTTIAASIMGHSPSVNESNYTYDVSNMDYKIKVAEKATNILMCG